MGVAFQVYVLCSWLTVMDDEQHLTYFTGMLCKALNLAEQLHGGDSQTPQAGVVLGLLGHVYARSKRITLAEGLHRSGHRHDCQWSYAEFGSTTTQAIPLLVSTAVFLARF